jgi:hypothetical protein
MALSIARPSCRRKSSDCGFAGEREFEDITRQAAAVSSKLILVNEDEELAAITETNLLVARKLETN